MTRRGHGEGSITRRKDDRYQAADLPDVRFHDLRHGAATVLLAAKIDLKAVSELLGHSSVAITADIYQKVLSEQQQEIVNRMDDLFGHS